jgi:hypothetical protein
VVQTLATSGNHVESTGDISVASLALCRRALSRAGGLQQNSFCFARMQNHLTQKPGKRRTWAPRGQHGYTIGTAMHHYRCQNIYLSATASGRIVDTLEFFPHNYQMPQLSSTNRLLMASKDMTDALQNPHPEVPFASVRDDTVKGPHRLSSNFQTQITASSVPCNTSLACHNHSTPKPHSLTT